jgi:hypothetical protein
MALTRTNTSLRRLALLALGTALMSTQAYARVGQVCLELPAGAGIVKAEIGSGCLPTSPGHKGEFETKVDRSSATISINGAYRQVGNARIGTTDCMGSQVIRQEVEAAGPRRYSVLINGQYSGVIDASDTRYGMRTVKECFAGSSQVQVPRPEVEAVFLRQHFRDWIARPRGSGKQTTDPIYRANYSTVAEAVAVLLGNHPEGMEGRPSAKVTISKARWRGGPFVKPPALRFMAVQIEEHGYLDDSVSGKRTFADIRPNRETGGWRIVGHWHQVMCARGDKAGQWSGEPCV